MATRPVAVAALSAALLAACAGCSAEDDRPAAPQPSTVTFLEVDLQVQVPAQLADLTYTLGEAEEGQPALYFSTEQLASVGGPSCAAGAEAAVSPYPLGQEANPEENVGRFVKQVGDRYLYYVSPPTESCAGDRNAARLQRDLTVELRSALETLRAAP